MANINDLKEKVINSMYDMDVGKMNLYDMGSYVDIMRKIAKIGEQTNVISLLNDEYLANNDKVVYSYGV